MAEKSNPGTRASWSRIAVAMQPGMRVEERKCCLDVIDPTNLQTSEREGQRAGCLWHGDGRAVARRADRERSGGGVRRVRV
jgi:hypothetical protein